MGVRNRLRRAWSRITSNREPATAGDVETAYWLVMGRRPDHIERQTAKEQWVGQVDAGEVYASLIERDDFPSRIAAHGPQLARSPEEERRGFDPSASETDVFYAYRLLLSRFPDEGGFNNYAGSTSIESMVSAVLGSPEFRGTRLHRVLERPESSDYRQLELPGFKLFISASDPTNEVLLSEGSYEPHVTEAVRRALGEGSVFCDVGANIGYYTNLAASIVGDVGKVLAFEARGENCASIRASVASNDFRNVTVLPFALSDSCGFRRYLRAEGSNGFIDSLTIPRGQDTPPTGAEETVQTMPLDALTPHLERLDLIKLDIEGAEARAVLGARNLLAKHRPLVVTELSPEQLVRTSGISADEYLCLFAQLGYRFEILEVEPVFCPSVERVLERHSRLGGGHTNVLCRPEE